MGAVDFSNVVSWEVVWGSMLGPYRACSIPIGRVDTKSWNVWLSHIKWRFWEKSVGIYVDGIEICDIPIGEDDTRGSPVWVFYRNWLYGGKIARKIGPTIKKNVGFCTNVVEKNRIWAPTSGNSRKMFFKAEFQHPGGQNMDIWQVMKVFPVRFFRHFGGVADTK